MAIIAVTTNTSVTAVNGTAWTGLGTVQVGDMIEIASGVTLTLVAGTYTCKSISAVNTDGTFSNGILALGTGSTWILKTALYAGTGSSFLSVGSGKTITINDTNGGSAANAYCVYCLTGGVANIGLSRGGTGSNAHGCATNGGTANIQLALGGSYSEAHGCTVFTGTANVIVAIGSITSNDSSGVVILSSGTANITVAVGGSMVSCVGLWMMAGTATVGQAIAHPSGNNMGANKYGTGGTMTLTNKIAVTYTGTPTTITNTFQNESIIVAAANVKKDVPRWTGSAEVGTYAGIFQSVAAILG